MSDRLSSSDSDGSHRYELCYILKQDTAKDVAQDIQKRLAALLQEQSGTLESQDEWPVRAFSYPVGKETKGRYVFTQISSGPMNIKPIQTYLSHQEAVLRHDIYRLEEDYDYEAVKNWIAKSERYTAERYSDARMSYPPREFE